MRFRWLWPHRRAQGEPAGVEETDPKLPACAVTERRAGGDRRRDSRIRLSLELAVPVTVRTHSLVEQGLARNLSEGGMLIQLRELPPIGERLEITIHGVQGSADAPESVTLEGEVRHHLAWQYQARGQRKTMRGVGVRFVDPDDREELWPSWVRLAGQTVH